MRSEQPPRMPWQCQSSAHMPMLAAAYRQNKLVMNMTHDDFYEDSVEDWAGPDWLTGEFTGKKHRLRRQLKKMRGEIP